MTKKEKFIEWKMSQFTNLLLKCSGSGDTGAMFFIIRLKSMLDEVYEQGKEEGEKNISQLTKYN